MKSSALALTVLVAFGLALPAQTPAPPQQAGQFYSQAVILQREGKIAEATVTMQKAALLAPKFALFATYRQELESIYGSADKHALQAPKEAEQSMERLTAYFANAATSDRDKARMIFRWITDRIAYDFDGLVANKLGDSRPPAVLVSRKAVCDGYAELFTAMGKAAGLEVVHVRGFSKGGSYQPGQKLTAPDHSWNAVKLDGQWHLLDATWSAGVIRDRKYVKDFRNSYWLTPPQQFIFTHLPEDAKWQLLEPPITLADFEQWPKVPHELFEVGVAVKDVQAALQGRNFREFVEPLRLSGPKVAVHTAPLERVLKAGGKYRWRIEAPGFQEMVVETGGKLVPLARRGSGFEGEVPVGKGDVRVSGRYLFGPVTYYAILRYRAE